MPAGRPSESGRCRLASVAVMPALAQSGQEPPAGLVYRPEFLDAQEERRLGSLLEVLTSAR